MTPDMTHLIDDTPETLPWASPHRQHPDGSPSRWRATQGVTWADTYPTAPAPLAAEAATDVGSEPSPAPRIPRHITATGWALLLIGATSAGAVIGGAVLVARAAGWL